MASGRRWRRALLIPAIGIVEAVRLVIKLAPDSAGAVVSLVSLVFPVVRVSTGAPTAEWVFGRLLVFVSVLLFSAEFYDPRYRDSLPTPLWRVAFSGGTVLIAVLFEQAVGGAWVGFSGPPSVFRVDASAAGAVLLGAFGGVLVTSFIEQRGYSGRQRPDTVRVTARSYVLMLLAGLLIAFVLLVGSLVDVLAVSVVVVGVVWMLSPNRSFGDIDQLEALVVRSVSGVWGGYETALLSVYAFIFVYVLVLATGAVWSALPGVGGLLSSPVNAVFLLGVVGSTLLYVFCYTIRLNHRIHERVYNPDAYGSSETPPNRVAGLLVPVPVAYYAVDSAFPAVDFAATVRPADLLAPIAVESLLVGFALVGLNLGLIYEAFATDGVLWRLSFEGRPFDLDEHVVPLTVSVVVWITGFLWVGSYSPLDRPVQFVLGGVFLSFLLLSPYYGFYLIGYLRSNEIESDRLRWIAATWGLGGIGVTVYGYLLFFLPSSYAQLVTSTLGFILGLWFVFVALPTALSSKLSPLTLLGSVAVFLLGTAARLAVSPLGNALVSTAYNGLSDPFSNPVDFVVTVVIGWSVIGIYAYIDRADV